MTQPTELTRRIGAYCSSTYGAGEGSAVRATLLARPALNNWPAGISYGACKDGALGRTPRPVADFAKRLEAFERRYPATAAMARARNLFPSE
jgi:hypothetical protein